MKASPMALSRVAATALLIAGGVAQTTTSSSAAPTGTNGVIFVYPTKDQIYNFMDTVNVTYTSPFPTPNLFTFCDGVSVQRALGYNGTIPYILNFTSATPCWFNLRPGLVAGFGANSEAFTIIGQERASGSRVFGPDNTPTVSPPPFTTSPAQTPPTGPNGSVQPPSTGVEGTETRTLGSGNTAGAAVVSEGGESGMSTAASAGIGAGVGVGVLAFGLGAFVWWWKRRGKKSRMQGGSKNGSDGTSTLAYSDVMYSPTGHTPVGHMPVVLEIGSGYGPSEIGSSGRPGKYEMPG
ncbi:hypothetical protein QBC34DRAFT_443413 [Podospora aff. communis PSN243]|uniref:Mid2 domain-containing protein n=1 Tax=Podospora aff. communis PSN243 TaxID=3040156 RepID=A0AAV9G4J4_9PEZI|nr:hypothetical protein QBC34DRAFT_443413 [Podospora aff. communis PSN243]